MEKTLAHVNKNNLVPLANIVGLAALAGFTIKNNIELNKKINKLQDEINFLKNNFNENNKRSNIAFTRLNQKIEETSIGLRNQGKYLQKINNRDSDNIEVEEVSVENLLPEKQDDVGDALNVLMNRT